MFMNSYSLLDLPMPIKTDRLLLRPFNIGDGQIVNDAILESFQELHTWMKWADHKPSVSETEINMRKAQAKWILREELAMLIFDIKTGKFLGASGFHHIDWSVPTLHTGYWIRSSERGKGIITESTHALIFYAFKQLHAKRLEIRCDENNLASRRVAEKLGFNCEGILINNELNPQGELRNTIVYARYNADNLPHLNCIW